MSRAIDALELKRSISAYVLCEDGKRIFDIIDEQPTIEPERKTGRWIYNSPITMKCSQCGLVIKDWDWNRFKICPCCGAEMKGDGND